MIWGYHYFWKHPNEVSFLLPKYPAMPSRDPSHLQRKKLDILLMATRNPGSTHQLRDSGSLSTMIYDGFFRTIQTVVGPWDFLKHQHTMNMGNMTTLFPRIMEVEKWIPWRQVTHLPGSPFSTSMVMGHLSRRERSPPKR